MLIHPQFDPIAFHLGDIAVPWYGLAYFSAFLVCWGLAHYRIHAGLSHLASHAQINDCAFYIFLAVVAGGRLGYALFYNPVFYLTHPLEILATKQGGMSFHGGFFAVIFMTLWLVKKHQRNWWQATDFLAPIVPFGLMLGRIGNFINGELWGRPADPNLPWAMVFPGADALPRHPVQLYHAALEGLALFLLLWWYCRKPRPTGAASGLFLIGYGIFRLFTEFFREPDRGIFGQSYNVTLGQWLSLPLIVAATALIVWASRRRSSTGVICGMFFFGYGVFRLLVEFFRAPERGGLFGTESFINIGQCLSFPMIALGVFLFWLAHTRHQGFARRVRAVLNLDFSARSLQPLSRGQEKITPTAMDDSDSACGK
ncbi:MAG: prolipoprotein diacylglyceryl transferase [Zoogloeaceae bacterium]|jgi:phosphatidylglycerol:prolipoprotein diacylglycerol transferase|nr:prolipoprotein diacylglyceryl transferase [Zoogloeaceae bacterium]